MRNYSIKTSLFGIAIAFSAIFVLSPKGASAVSVSLPWSTTYNCPEWNATSTTLGQPIGCDDMETPGVDPTQAGHLEQITSDANYPGGGGGRGQRHWIGGGVTSFGCGDQDDTGGVVIRFPSTYNEIWVRWYQRFQTGFSWSSYDGFKLLYVQPGMGYFQTAYDSYPIGSSFNIYTNHGDNKGWGTMDGYGYEDLWGDPSLGQWHAIEVHFKKETSGSNGIMQFWADGILRANHSTVNYGTGTVSWLELPGNAKTFPCGAADMYVDFDDVAVTVTTPAARDAQGNPMIGPLGWGGGGDATSPTWPTGTTFSASATSSSSITVTWSAATDNFGVTGYTVQRCTGLPAACPDASFATVGTPTASPFVNNTGLSANTDYSYRVLASDAAGNTSGWTNVVSARTQSAIPTAPTITTQPQSTTGSVGSTVTFTVIATGTTPLSYQWQRNSVNISGATNSSYTTPTLALSDSGSTYRVIVTNSVGSVTSNAATLTVTASPTPLVAYNFDEGSGTTVNDISGNNRTGTLMGGPTRVSGQMGHGQSLSFDGVDDSVDAGSASLGLTNSITVSAWVQSAADTNGRILSKHTGGSYGWLLTRSADSDALEWRVSTNGGDWTGGITNANSFPLNQWIHVAATYDGATMRVYMNGVEESGGSFPVALMGNIFNSTGSLQVGRDGYIATVFSGLIDDVRIYGRALTQSQIQSDMNTPVSGGNSSVACNTVTPSNFSQSAYNAYGAPYDLFASNAQLVDAKCTASDPTTINATIGKAGDTTRSVYTKGYYFDPGINNWAQYTGTCTNALSGDWCNGPVTATITDSDLSTASAGAPAYFVGMVCSVQNGGWRCGCRDTTCSNFYWMIQGAGQ